jgi:hypothetical protein
MLDLPGLEVVRKSSRKGGLAGALQIIDNDDKFFHGRSNLQSDYKFYNLYRKTKI